MALCNNQLAEKMSQHHCAKVQQCVHPGHMMHTRYKHLVLPHGLTVLLTDTARCRSRCSLDLLELSLLSTGLGVPR